MKPPTEVCPHHAVDRSDPATVVESLLREPEKTDNVIGDFLAKQQAHALGRGLPAMLVEHEVARSYGQITLAPLGHMVMLQAVQTEPTVEAGATIYERFDSIKTMLETIGHKVMNDVESGPYARLGTHFADAILRYFTSLRAVKKQYPHMVHFKVPATPLPRDWLAAAASSNVGTAETFLYPDLIAEARTLVEPPTQQFLLDAGRVVTPSVAAVSTVPRMVSLEVQFGRKLQKRRNAESRAGGLDGCPVSPEVAWRKALELYTENNDKRIFEQPACDYDTTLLDPETPAYMHRIIAEGGLSYEKAGYCAGQLQVTPTEDERPVFDAFFQRQALAGVPKHGVMASEVVAWMTLERANQTLFASEVWREGIFEAARAVTAARR